MNYALDEEEKARVFQKEAEKYEMDVRDLQNEMNEKNRLIADVREREQQHRDEAKRLREQSNQEKRDEEEERARRERENSKESLMKKAAKESIRHGLLG
jgi:peptidoglycan hydrolase CwlO-like protein